MKQVLDVIRQGFSLKISLFWDTKWYGFESRKVKGFLHSQNQDLGLGESLILERTDGCWKPLRISPLWHALGEVCVDVYVCLYKNQWASYPRGSNTRIPGPLWHGMSAVQGNTWRAGLPLQDFTQSWQPQAPTTETSLFSGQQDQPRPLNFPVSVTACHLLNTR